MRDGNDRANIAVLVPSHNPGEKLAATLASLRQQTVPYKVFVVDDGSDPLPDYDALLEGIEHTLIKFDENRGITAAMNAGLDAIIAEGGFDYVARIDCGDLCYPNRLEVQRDYLLEHPEIAMIGSDADVFLDEHTFAYVTEMPANQEELETALYYNMQFNHPTMMFRRTLFEEVGFYVDDFHAAEDYEIVRRVAAAGYGIANVSVPLIKEVLQAGGISATRRTRQLISRLGIQWRYRDLTNPHCWLGMAKTCVLMVTPQSLVQFIKVAVRGSRTGAGYGLGHVHESRSE